MNAVAVASFGIAAVAFAVLTALVLLHFRVRRAMLGLLLAVAGTALWAVVTLLLLIYSDEPERWLWPVDAVHSAVWLVFLATLLPSIAVKSWWRLLVNLAAILGIAIALLLAAFAPTLLESHGFGTLLLLSLSLLGLSAVEQIFRNSKSESRRLLNPLCLAIGTLFAFDLFVYSHGLLVQQLDATLWTSRGLVNALLAIPLLVGARRNPELTPQLYLSRQITFHSAALVGAGIYLIAMSVAGYVLRVRGGEWGPVLQATFLVAALLLLAYIFAQKQIRAKFKVLFSKHLYRSKYDYRGEWLRLIATMSDRSIASVPERALKALANILDAESARLWLWNQANECYEPSAGIGETAGGVLANENSLVTFLAKTNWIVDTSEYHANSEKYSRAFSDLEGTEGLAPGHVYVPLRHDGRLLGIARLDAPARIGSLNFEDHDLLKTVGRQMAVFIQQELDQLLLAEAKQFEAFNRTTAFLMHDLKNLIAQQSLIVENAPRFRHRSEFIDDVLSTIERSVERMKKVLAQLQGNRRQLVNSSLSLAGLLQEVVLDSGGSLPVPVLDVKNACSVSADWDRLSMVVRHAIRNAQDATPSTGSIVVELDCKNGNAEISVIDTGSGMDEAFIRDRLFRPFDSTKAASGMGIGAHQIREYVISLGGRVEVESARGRGTRFRMVLPGNAEVRIEKCKSN